MGNKIAGQQEKTSLPLCEHTMTEEDASKMLAALSENDMKLAQRVWSEAVADIEQDVSVDIFKLILSKSEAVRKLFGVGEKEYDRIDTSGRYVSHARLVKNALDLFLHDLNSGVDRQRVVTTLRSLGARHVTFRYEGFQPDFWYIFAASMVEVTRVWPVPKWQRARFDNVWRTLICFVIVNMKIGYQQELCKVDAFRALSIKDDNEAKTEPRSPTSVACPEEIFVSNECSTCASATAAAEENRKRCEGKLNG